MGFGRILRFAVIFATFSAGDFGALGGGAGLNQTYEDGGEGLDRLIVPSTGRWLACIRLKMSLFVRPGIFLPDFQQNN